LPLLKSLFCLQGKDNRERFIIIQLATALAFILLNVLAPNSTAFLLVVALILTTMSGLSVKRRQHDAKINKLALYAPTLMFLGLSIATALSDSMMMVLSMLVPVIGQLYLFTYKGSESTSRYQLGYYGPIDLGQSQPNYQQKSVNRVEPTLAGGHSSSEFTPSIEVPVTEHTNEIHSEDDWGEKLRDTLTAHKVKLLIASGAALFLIIAIIAINLLTSTTEQTETVVTPIEQLATTTYEQNNIVTLSDGFEISSNQYQGINITWQADETLREELWNIAHAEGDESCKALTFNNKQTIRTAQVLVENQTGYVAVFSPLDSHELINQLAKRGSFKLCGYDFSLKGSQAALGKVRYYGELLSY